MVKADILHYNGHEGTGAQSAVSFAVKKTVPERSLTRGDKISAAIAGKLLWSMDQKA